MLLNLCQAFMQPVIYVTVNHLNLMAVIYVVP